MLTRTEALKAKHVLSTWLAKKNDRMTPDEEETIELLLISPVGDRACSKLGTTLHHVRDLFRLGYGPVPAHLDAYAIGHHLKALKEMRDRAGLQTSNEHMMTAGALLSGPAGKRIASDLGRLDAVVTILFGLPRAVPAEASR